MLTATVVSADGQRATTQTRRARLLAEELDPPDIRRVAVITGACTGIGEAIARRLAERDWLTVLVARREELLRTLAEELEGEYEVCDVGDREAVERMAAAVAERHPAIGMLVNNAGMPGRGDFTTLDPERIERVTDVNYLGTVWCTRAFLPALEAGRPSHIVNIVSVAGTVAWGPAGPYAASKHAQLAFSRGLTGQLAPRGISVHTVNPGFVESGDVPAARPPEESAARAGGHRPATGRGGRHARGRPQPPGDLRAALVPGPGDRPGARPRADGALLGLRRLQISVLATGSHYVVPS